MSSIERRRREGSHSSGIKTGISVSRPLVILCGAHDLDRLSVAESKDGDLTSRHIFLYHHAVPGHAEFLILHDLFYSVKGLLLSIADKDSLSERETVSLQHYRIFGRFKICLCFFGIIKHFICRRGYTVLFHKILGKDLASLYDRGVRSRAEAWNALLF